VKGGDRRKNLRPRLQEDPGIFIDDIDPVNFRLQRRPDIKKRIPHNTTFPGMQPPFAHHMPEGSAGRFPEPALPGEDEIEPQVEAPQQQVDIFPGIVCHQGRSNLSLSQVFKQGHNPFPDHGFGSGPLFISLQNGPFSASLRLWKFLKMGQDGFPSRRYVLLDARSVIGNIHNGSVHIEEDGFETHGVKAGRQSDRMRPIS